MLQDWLDVGIRKQNLLYLIRLVVGGIQLPSIEIKIVILKSMRIIV